MKATDNRLLASLSGPVRDALAAHLTPCCLSAGEALQHEEAAIEHVYFPVSGIISSTLVMPHGAEVVAALIGNEGATCGGAELCGRALARAKVQLPGMAWRIPYTIWQQQIAVADARELLASYRALRLYESQQNAACNLLHDVESRLCRWILQIHDRVGRAIIPMTHADLAAVTGIRRTTVTLIIGGLHAAGIIGSRRSAIEVIDRFALEAAACECYGVISTRQKLLAASAASPRDQR